MSLTEQERLRVISLPSKLGEHLAKDIWGEPYVPFPFVQHMEQRIIEAVLDTTHERYIAVSTCPQVGKSSYVGLLLPFWLTGMFPAQQVMYLSYSDDFSAARGKDVRAMHQRWGRELFGTAIDPDFSAGTDWRIKGFRGGMLSAGVGGQITGRPGHCFPGDTLVATPRGDERIDLLAQSGGSVWGYDHLAERIVERPIRAGRRVWSDDLVEITFASGRKLRCTRDHPIWVDGIGYLGAGLVEVGAKVSTVGQPTMHDVRITCDDAGLRVRQEGTTEAPGHLLLQSVSPDGAAPPDELEVPGLRPASTEGTQVLLGHVQAARRGTTAEQQADLLSAVWDHVRPPQHQNDVLREGMRGRRALSPDEGGRQPSLQDGNLLLEVVPGDARSHHRAGRGLCGLWPVRAWANRHGDSPHQRGPHGQPGDEPRRPMSAPPPQSPQICRDAVSMVAAVRGSGEPVYDLEVEETGNFFAEGVLVHNCIIIDDLIKNAEEARSKATKSLHVAEWDGTISRRLQPGGTVILIATRWDEGDLQGVLKARMAEPGYDGPRWEFIEYPAFAEMPEDLELTEAERDEWRDVLGRKEGEVLDCRFSRIEGRDPADFFNLAKAGMDRYAWSALYQQHPSVTEGGMFPKDAWVYEAQETWPDMVEVVRVWDLAVTEDAGDFTVGTKVGRGSDGRFYIMDVQRFRKAAGGVQDAVELQAHLDGFATRIMIEEEKGAAGKTVIEFYKRLLPMRRVDPAKAEGDKVSRATPYSAQQNRHQVVLPLRAEASWSVADFVDEHAKLMPDGRGPRNDDQIDTAAYGVASLIDAAAADIWMPSQGGLQVSAEAQMRRLLASPVDVLSGWSTR